ncbi:MAG: hypothetical protein NTV32_10855, partial [Gammaproteobacteria bacterium]|nr:hypothetical protein [Gammaproteobacteria bacterium]
MDLNLTNIIYLFFRLGPFILVSYFLLSSLFLQDFKSLIYLAGLLVACFFTILVGNMFPDVDINNVSRSLVCNQLSLGGGMPLSKLPLSLVVYSYTLWYLLYIMLIQEPDSARNAILSSNLPILIIFPFLIIADFTWLLLNSCNNVFRLVLTVILGSCCGAAWSAIIASSNLASLQYMSVMSNAAVCSRPSKTMFRCKQKSSATTKEGATGTSATGSSNTNGGTTPSGGGSGSGTGTTGGSNNTTGGTTTTTSGGTTGTGTGTTGTGTTTTTGGTNPFTTVKQNAQKALKEYKIVSGEFRKARKYLDDKIVENDGWQKSPNIDEQLRTASVNMVKAETKLKNASAHFLSELQKYKTKTST